MKLLIFDYFQSVEMTISCGSTLIHMRFPEVPKLVYTLELSLAFKNFKARVTPRPIQSEFL